MLTTETSGNVIFRVRSARRVELIFLKLCMAGVMAEAVMCYAEGPWVCNQGLT